jgi:phosphocarrier protein FPr
MFPMVSAVDELRRARALLDDVLAAEAGGAVDGLRVGIMVEVPATALKLDAFAGLLDFVSIGTNDLTQYALAAERGNPHVAALSDPLDPGVLALVAACCRAAGTAPGTQAPGRWRSAARRRPTRWRCRCCSASGSAS